MARFGPAVSGDRKIMESSAGQAEVIAHHTAEVTVQDSRVTLGLITSIPSAAREQPQGMRSGERPSASPYRGRQNAPVNGGSRHIRGHAFDDEHIMPTGGHHAHFTDDDDHDAEPDRIETSAIITGDYGTVKQYHAFSSMMHPRNMYRMTTISQMI